MYAISSINDIFIIGEQAKRARHSQVERNQDFTILFIYLFIYMVHRTSFFFRASNYILVKHFQFYGARGNPVA